MMMYLSSLNISFTNPFFVIFICYFNQIVILYDVLCLLNFQELPVERKAKKLKSAQKKMKYVLFIFYF